MKSVRSRSGPEFRARLECGHETWLRNPPMTGQVRYGCNLGLGCGYSLMWVEWWRISALDVRERNELYDGSTNHEGDTA